MSVSTNIINLPWNQFHKGSSVHLMTRLVVIRLLGL